MGLPMFDSDKSHNTWKSFICIFAGTWILYQLAKTAYNVFLHPLRHIPGPKLAAATYLPEFYYDLVRFGRYTRRIEQMHKKYGPLVRISPDEVHCNDSHFLDEIYAAGGRKRDKPLHQLRSITMLDDSIFSTASHNTHRMRRAALAKLFTRPQISRLEPTISNFAQRLCDKILTIGKERPFDVTVAYSCCTTDVISEYCFDQTLGLTAQKGWRPNFREPMSAQLKLMYFFRFFPSLKYAGDIVAKLGGRLGEDMALLIRTFTVDIANLVKKAKLDMDAGRDVEPTIFTSLFESDLPPSEKSVQRMSSEAIQLFIAGTETISWTLTVITYHLLSRPALLAKLTAELTPVFGDSEELPAWSTLEKLPFLEAVISEGLRLSYGAAGRTSRIPTEEDLVYRGSWRAGDGGWEGEVQYVIPRGYAVGTSAAIMHHDESVFPDSHSFVPERWLDEKGQHRKELDRALLSFSKGSRGCIGINLAYCELYLVLALLVVRVFPRMQLHDTSEKDVRYDHDFFAPQPVSDSKGVRAVIV